MGIYLNVLGSKDISPITDLNAQDFCDDIDMKETIDLGKKLPLRKENVGNETDLNNPCATKRVEKENLDICSNVLTSMVGQTSQTKIKSNEQLGETVYISPDLVSDSSLDIHVISSEHKENISDMQNNYDSCNIKCEKINFVMGNQSTQEKVCNPIDNLLKLTENLLDTNSACLEGIPSMVVKQVDLTGTVDVIDEVKFVSD